MSKICFIFPKLNEKFSKTICALIEVYEPTPDEEAEMFGDDELPPDENT